MTDTTDDGERGTAPRVGISAPLFIPVFRRIWLASLMSNLGMMILGVGAAWAMTQLTEAADMIALVQSALTFPVMLIAIMAGAIADMYDRRLVSILALVISLLGTCALVFLAAAGWLTPWLLLLFCFVIGCGTALLWPSWQASVSEQVPVENLPQAVALNSISFNIARSIGPALGGIIVAIAGAVASFVANALLYIPLLIVLFQWRRKVEPSRLPPERLARAVNSGVRYAFHSPPLRAVLTRSFALAVTGGAMLALMPVVARDLLNGTAMIYGLILGAFGIGAVTSALNISRIRERFDSDKTTAVSALVTAAMIVVVAMSHNLLVTVLALLVMGATWMLIMTMFNIVIQLAAPRWVTGRVVAGFQTATSGGVALGSWFWGHVAETHGVTNALLASAVTVALTALLGRWLPMPDAESSDHERVELDAPQVALPLTGRSGPIVLEIEYRVAAEEARIFYGVMQQIQHTRHRNGGYQWSIARDIADPELWTERYHCPTWHDYLRMRDRYTAEDMVLQERAEGFHRGPGPARILRRLERPFGSVRWRDDAPDPETEILSVVTPLSNG